MKLILNKNCKKYIELSDDIICDYMNKKYGEYFVYTTRYDSDRNIAKIKKNIEFDDRGYIILNNIENGGVFIFGKYYGEYVDISHKKTFSIDRKDHILMDLIESNKWKQKLNFLKVVEIPDDIEYEIFNRGNGEEVHEKHRIWG